MSKYFEELKQELRLEELKTYGEMVDKFSLLVYKTKNKERRNWYIKNINKLLEHIKEIKLT